jgi:hypothetical protein
METLQFKHTFSSGVVAEIKKDGTDYYLSLSGAPLDSVLTAVNLDSLDLQAPLADIKKLSRLLINTASFIETSNS